MDPFNGEGNGQLPDLVDEVSEYFMSLIVGVILLYVLWEIVISLGSELPPFFKWGIAIVLAAAGALLFKAKTGI